MSRKGRTSLLCWWSLQWWRVYIDSFFLQKEKHLEDKLSIALITSLDFPFYMRNWKIMWIYKTVSRTNSELDKLEVFISFFLTFIYEIVTSKFQTIFFFKKKDYMCFPLFIFKLCELRLSRQQRGNRIILPLVKSLISSLNCID